METAALVFYRTLRRKMRYGVMSGDKLRYNQATLRDFRLQRDLEEEDFPPED